MYKKCVNCGNSLPRESTARRKFCDARCRVEYNRASSPQSSYGDAMRAITALGNAKHGDKKKAIEALKTLKQAIDFEVRKLGDKDAIYKHQMIEDHRKYPDLSHIDPINYD